ncbi:MAG: TonB-dependent receptor plug domain-containing protein [Verrucomicrobia bacterium]|nr:TonB-dependent receptor plug domain-containing protein [Verrucomicrobiota bacterium]
MVATTLACCFAAQAQTDLSSTNESTTLPTVVIYGEAEYEGVAQDPFLPPVQGTAIYSGKKATLIDLDALPKVVANNYRQALAKTPGLLYSEETSPLVSIGYRGIGEPHRTQFLQVLKDGIPIHADQFGYPEAYYTPPLDVVDRIEFIRGGASLMYGPQPAGALNYITYQPRRDREFSLRTYNTFGSDNLFSTYSAVDGTSGRLGYLAYYNRRQSDGFRTANSDYVLDGGHFKLVLDADQETRWTLALDAYEEEHGESGGLTLATGAGLANYNQNRDQVTKQFDRFRLRRYIPSVTLAHDFSENTQAEIKAWGGYYERFSKRQRGGGFGTFPTGANANSNDIERQEFYTFGTDARLRHDYQFSGETHTLAGGLHFYRGDSPRTDRRGATADAETGNLLSESQRDVLYGSLFAENRFQFGRLSLTPGVRLETVAQDVSVSRPTTNGPALSAKDKTEFQPLLAFTAAYALPRQTEIYASVAQGYRATIFTESIVPGSGSVITGDVAPTTTWTYELGYRGQPTDWLTWDTSLFFVDLDNKFGGTVNVAGQTELRSVGRSLNYGWDAAVELDLLGAAAAARGAEASKREHRLSLYGNLSLLEAEIHGGTSDGKRPQYAPDYLVRAGVIYRWLDRVKIGLLGTFLDDHFASDDENPTRLIPAYMTWDLTAEVKVYKDTVSIIGGINNLFDEDYYARIRGDGIDPAYGRNFYAGLQLSF